MRTQIKTLLLCSLMGGAALGGCSSDSNANSDSGMPSGTADMATSGGDEDMNGGTGVRPTGFPELPAAPTLTGHKLTVGSGKMYAKPCAALTAAVDGDTIEIDPGTYSGDTCTITKNNLYIHGVGGTPIIDNTGVKPSGCKGVWVVDGNDTVIEDVEIMGGHLRPTDSYVTSGSCSADKNGAGIRWEGGNLTLRRVSLHDNDDGILGGNIATAAILIEYSQFYKNSYDGFSHNLYINQIAQLTFRYNYSSRTTDQGHLLKSRARKNVVLYNRLSDENSAASYEINLPNGGESYVIGNLIQQSATTGNGAMLDYLSEGLGTGFDNHLYVVNNTFVNDRSAGTFIQTASGTSTDSVNYNNVFVGNGTQSTNIKSGGAILGVKSQFVDPTNYDYHFVAGTTGVDATMDPGQVSGVSLAPVNEYVHPAAGKARAVGSTLTAGAFQL